MAMRKRDLTEKVRRRQDRKINKGRCIRLIKVAPRKRKRMGRGRKYRWEKEENNRKKSKETKRDMR